MKYYITERRIRMVYKEEITWWTNLIINRVYLQESGYYKQVIKNGIY